MLHAVQSCPVFLERTCSHAIVEIQKVLHAITDLFLRIIGAPGAYFLKISLYRSSAMQDPFSQWIMAPLALGVTNLWKRTQGLPPQDDRIDPARLQRGADFLREFAEVCTLQTQDGTEIRWALYRSEKFEQWITANGGVRIGDRITPRTPPDWERLKRLREFKWFEEIGQSFRVPAPVAGAQNNCVLRCKGFGVPMTMDKAYVGLHLAAGFSYAVFDWRQGTSIKGFFEDAETCYQALLSEGFSPQQIKLMGSCRGTFPTVYLKTKHHDEGVDAMLMQPPPSLRAVVANQPPPSNWIAMLGIDAVESGDGEEHYNSIRRLQTLQPSSGRLCLLMSEGDKTIPHDTTEQFRRAAHHAGPFSVIEIPKGDQEMDAHFSEPLRDPEAFRGYTEFLAGRMP